MVFIVLRSPLSSSKFQVDFPCQTIVASPAPVLVLAYVLLLCVPGVNSDANHVRPMVTQVSL